MFEFSRFRFESCHLTAERRTLIFCFGLVLESCDRPENLANLVEAKKGRPLAPSMGVDEVAAYSKAVTKQRIASICLALGWNSIGTLSMEVSLVARLLLLTLSMLQYPIFKYCFHHPLTIAAPDFTRLTDSLHPIIGG